MQSQAAPVDDLVDLKMNKYQVLASGKVVETVDEMLGSLLDTNSCLKQASSSGVFNRGIIFPYS